MNFAGAVTKNSAPVQLHGAVYNSEFFKRPGFLSISKLERPQTVRINTPKTFLPDVTEIYDAISNHIKAGPVSIARNQYGDIVVTLPSKKRKDALLAIGYVELQGEKFEVLDPVDPITNVVVLGVPYELSDKAVTEKLRRYGDIVGSRRGHHPGMPAVENGIRNYRIKLQTNIPSYIHFGSESLRVRYNNQPPTCRECDSPDHIANSCRVQRCFNCDEKDHTLPACQSPPRCAICSSTDHLAEMCGHWETMDAPDDEEPSDDSDEDTLQTAVNKMIEDEIRSKNTTSPELFTASILPDFQLPEASPPAQTSPASAPATTDEKSRTQSTEYLDTPSPVESNQKKTSWADDAEEEEKRTTGTRRALSEESSSSSSHTESEIRNSKPRKTQNKK